MVVNHIIDGKVNVLQNYFIQFEEDGVLITGRSNQLSVKLTFVNYYLTLQNQHFETKIVDDKVLTVDKRNNIPIVSFGILDRI